VDLFHVVTPHEWNPILGLIIKILKKPLVYTLHDPNHHLGTPLYMKISERLIRKLSDAIVVLSKAGREQLIQEGLSSEKVFHIPHGTYIFFRKWQQQIEQEKMILFFGRIEPYKGLDNLLDAMPTVFEALPEWKLVIAGSGDISPYRERINDPRIEIINKYIPDEEVARLMQRAGLVVLPYIEATQSGVILVAYAFARPVIATDVGSLKEMVLDGKTGLLIPPNDTRALAKAIRTIASDPFLSGKMGRYAYEMSEREWNWTKIAQRHLEAYSNVLRSFESA
jgi:glycosyltransferase involved in cell wall biosynthesis